MQMYLRRAERIIGERTPAEIAHDDEVVAGLEMGLSIEAALANAAQKHPTEALQWDADSIGDIDFPPRASEEYTQALQATVAPDAIRAAGFKLVVDYSYGAMGAVMPTLLGKLAADVLAVNPFVSTPGRLAYDAAEGAERLGALVRASGAQLGAQIDADGERLTLVDETGRILSHTEAMLAFVSLIPRHLVGNRIALPANTTEHAGLLMAERGVQIQLTKISSPALMAAASEPGVGFACDGEGGYIVPGFLPAFDGAAALLKMLDLLAREHTLSLIHISEPTRPY